MARHKHCRRHTLTLEVLRPLVAAHSAPHNQQNLIGLVVVQHKQHGERRAAGLRQISRGLQAPARRQRQAGVGLGRAGGVDIGVPGEAEPVRGGGKASSRPARWASAAGRAVRQEPAACPAVAAHAHCCCIALVPSAGQGTRWAAPRATLTAESRWRPPRQTPRRRPQTRVAAAWRP